MKEELDELAQERGVYTLDNICDFLRLKGFRVEKLKDVPNVDNCSKVQLQGVAALPKSALPGPASPGEKAKEGMGDQGESYDEDVEGNSEAEQEKDEDDNEDDGKPCKISTAYLGKDTTGAARRARKEAGLAECIPMADPLMMNFVNWMKNTRKLKLSDAEQKVKRIFASIINLAVRTMRVLVSGTLVAIAFC